MAVGLPTAALEEEPGPSWLWGSGELKAFSKVAIPSLFHSLFRW
jgi:hypothetical protein